MIKRDFSKSNKEYFKRNKFALIGLALLVIVGIVVIACFGFNGNFEMKGYTEFSVSVHTYESKQISKFSKEIQNIVESNGGNFDNISVFGEGENTKLIVRYLNSLSGDKQTAINEAVITKLSLAEEDVTAHVKVSKIVRNADYVYTALAIILLVTVSSIFAYFRYNGASAITTILSCVFATILYLCLTAILRITIGLSYFAMLVILNLLVVYVAFAIFEHIREDERLQTNDFAGAINGAVKSTKNRAIFLTMALFATGLLFVALAPNPLKYVSLNLLFLAVTLLADVWYVIPFVWSVFITYTHKKRARNK